VMSRDITGRFCFEAVALVSDRELSFAEQRLRFCE